ncbi:aspartate--tRNA ligase, mitochondrial [Leptopilina heterotoma]|uniref:aspartate--tRNA ligase, mitochondrial n=1 Tax=Leptopilina heterotoma TaxID=63436 RepID=UPI001CA81AB2|nr:aspartate--tRNA ligase, mitochondrial [Leptopilina heterotoma]
MFIRNRIIQRLCQQCVKNLKRKQNSVLNVYLKTERQICVSTVNWQNYGLASEKVSSFEKNLPVNRYAKRSHTCGELRMENVGETVTLSGWVEFQRMGKFVILRDGYGSTQLLVPEEREDLLKVTRDLNFESVITATGRVVERPADQENKSMKTGKIEILVDSVNILNAAKAQLPFTLRKFNKAKEQLQMQYRYLALRFPELQRNLRLRSEIVSKMREYLLNHCGFVDIETPTLFRRTPGGAQEFVVPTRLEGKFYSLVQSPQQFKQLLMIGGFDRYFQIARCYRDEGSRSDRQPEFTQLDIEISFSDREQIMELAQELVVYCWPEELGPIKLPFPQITFAEAMEKYGVDSPDLRIPNELQNITECFDSKFSSKHDKFGAYAVVFPNSGECLTKANKEKLFSIVRMYFNNTKLVQLKVSKDNLLEKLTKLLSNDAARNILEKIDFNDGDVLFLAYGDKTNSQTVAGNLRVQFANILEASGYNLRSSDYKFVWVVDFPLFTVENENLKSTHHPFTRPHHDDMEYLSTDPEKVRGLHYDLVMNGIEIGGGSIRIHEPELQTNILKMLNINTDQLNHLIEALSSGAPPHGGIALGIDRFVSLLCKSATIREVMAFPKTLEGKDLMSDAPAAISEKEKLLYHIK